MTAGPFAAYSRVVPCTYLLSLIGVHRALGEEDAQLRLIRPAPSKGSSGPRDPAHLFAALGPPDLRNAQKSFKEGMNQ